MLHSGTIAGGALPRPVKRRVLCDDPQALLIGLSTGGPQALASLLPELPADFPLPILIVQNMPPNFTRLLAERLSSHCSLRVEEAGHGHEVRRGMVLIAPGGLHMRVQKQSNRVVTVLDEGPQENGCRPAADVLFRSAAEVWGGQVFTAILTGMGRDGLKGVEVLRAKGAWILAQDEATSIVWGMPGAVVKRGFADLTVPLDQVVSTIVRRLALRRRSQ